MELQYALYDALIGINVPSDKARAVVDAVERDMGTTLATKLDLRRCATQEGVMALRGELRQEISGVKQDVAALTQDVAGLKQDVTGLKQDVAGLKQDVAGLKQEIAAVRTEMRQEFGAVRQDLDAKTALLRHEIDTTRQLLSKDIEAMRSSIVIWLGSAIVVAAGVVFAGLRAF
ncbi:MAG: DUF1640 domain-containing protein [Gammaproteobacteria bacterium]|nr:DUF1640 domain-containing protein [Gammaproteobacteria bacterium]